MRLVSWNVNGLRAVHGRGDLAWAFEGDLDVVCLQETKLQEENLTDALRAPPGFRSLWSFGKRKGYSGTAVFLRDGIDHAPLSVKLGGKARPDFDDEGRVTAVDLGAFRLLNLYCPNGQSSAERLAYKHAWHEALLETMKQLSRDKPLVVCGDFNVAHRAIDVAMPDAWADISGFLPVERAWFDRMLGAGFLDAFRAEKGDLSRQFTFWETRVDARSTNQGWRIDYFVVSRDLEDQLVDAWISPQIRGSDHCPTGIELDVPASAAVVDEEWDMADEDAGESDADDEEDNGGHRR